MPRTRLFVLRSTVDSAAMGVPCPCSEVLSMAFGHRGLSLCFLPAGSSEMSALGYSLSLWWLPTVLFFLDLWEGCCHPSCEAGVICMEVARGHLHAPQLWRTFISSLRSICPLLTRSTQASLLPFPLCDLNGLDLTCTPRGGP